VTNESVAMVGVTGSVLVVMMSTAVTVTVTVPVGVDVVEMMSVAVSVMLSMTSAVGIVNPGLENVDVTSGVAERLSVPTIVARSTVAIFVLLSCLPNKEGTANAET